MPKIHRTMVTRGMEASLCILSSQFEDTRQHFLINQSVGAVQLLILLLRIEATSYFQPLEQTRNLISIATVQIMNYWDLKWTEVLKWDFEQTKN